MAQSFLSWRGLKFLQMKARPFLLRGDNYEVEKIHWLNLKIFFSRTTEPISTKLGTKHPWVKGIQVCLNKGAFSKGRWLRNSKLWANVYIDLNWFLRWVMWPMGLLFEQVCFLGCIYHIIYTCTSDGKSVFFSLSIFGIKYDQKVFDRLDIQKDWKLFLHIS